MLRCWISGPSQAGLLNTEFLNLREYLRAIQPDFIANRQSLINPGIYLEDTELNVAMTYELLMYALLPELHCLEGLGGAKCQCVVCSSKLRFLVEVECPQCDALLVPVPLPVAADLSFDEGSNIAYLFCVLSNV